MIRLGTASWTDPTLLACGRFYPHDVDTPETRLRYYASQFPLVEVNASYYAIGSAMQAHHWTLRTPETFRFHVKAFRLFTGHPAPLAVLGADILRDWNPQERDRIFYSDLPKSIQNELWHRFLISLEPLRMRDRLDAVHFQFAPWITPQARHMHMVEDAVQRMTDHTVSIEWRHRDWFAGAQRARTLDWQREMGVVHTVVDAPQGFNNTVPAVWENTHSDLAVVRLHGRNTASWNHSGKASSSRFMYEYTEAELAELAERIRRVSKAVARTHVVLNTNHEDQGVRNARGLARALNSTGR